MKKVITLFSFVAIMSIGGTALAAENGVSECATMSKGKCVSMCAKEMERGVSQCATTPCEMEMPGC